MRKLFLFNLISIDGYFEGKNQSIDWHNVDEEFVEFALKQLEEIGVIMFGRITYELMASYWPSDDAIKSDSKTAEMMNNAEKIVFSRTLNSADWKNTKLINEDAAQEVQKLKQIDGKPIAIFGSSDLAASLANENLIDEYRIIINPLFLGEGKTLLSGLKQNLNLKLKSSKVFTNGNILLIYEK